MKAMTAAIDDRQRVTRWGRGFSAHADGTASAQDGSAYKWLHRRQGQFAQPDTLLEKVTSGSGAGKRDVTSGAAQNGASDAGKGRSNTDAAVE
jgi:hypothetical protein